MPKIYGFMFFVVFLFSCSTNYNKQYANSNVDLEVLAKIKLKLAMIYINNQDYAKAKKNLDIAYLSDNNSSDVNYGLAYYYQTVKENKLANKYYLKSLKLDKENGKINNAYAVFLCQNKQFLQAEKYFLKAINSKTYATISKSYENLAKCSFDENNFKKANYYLTKALNYDPNYKDYKLIKAWIKYKMEDFESSTYWLSQFHMENKKTLKSKKLARALLEKQKTINN